ncbi:MAG TPA: DUF5004 domain-containing protein [Mucilaginibacter sp.]|nr:DUF5004 domain-containing protein [Mucilaginibacter sp.]
MPALLLIGLLVNSCKRELDSDIPDLLVSGTWQLSSVRITINRGDSLKLDTTYSISCDQKFTFNTDKTCTYTNFDCKDQPTAKGIWELTDNRLTLRSNIVCQDTTAAGSSTPFSKCSINSLGRYSMVLLTGDYINYNSSAIRRVVRYGFVRQNASTQ